MKHVKSFNKLNEEYGPTTDTFSVGELREKLMSSDPKNLVTLSIIDDNGIPIKANIIGVSYLRMDKNRYDLVIEGIRSGQYDRNKTKNEPEVGPDRSLVASNGAPIHSDPNNLWDMGGGEWGSDVERHRHRKHSGGI